MEINNRRIDEIYSIVKQKISGFQIKKNNNYTNQYKSIIIVWPKLYKSGFFISCPRDLDTQIHLCEICLIDKNNALYSLYNGIEKVENYEHLFNQFYQYFLNLIILYNLPFSILKFYIKNKNKNKIVSLESKCRYQLTTHEISTIKYLII